jgi:SAM-dependent methyltransferase
MAQNAFDTTEHNAGIFDRADVAEWYAQQGAFPAEAAYLDKYGATIRGRKILDLGVGSGRTTRQLLPLSDDYIGIDLAPAMIETARRDFPQASFRRMDVRDIGKLEHGRFGFVNGALAIMSAFNHAERLTILAAVHDLLTDDGLFIFSAHNRDWRLAGGMPLHGRSWRPSQIVNSLHPVSWYNYLRLRHLRRETADYAILNDSAHRWTCVFYFIDATTQARQLADAGFDLIEIFGEDGRPVALGDDVSSDGLLHYVCRRSNAQLARNAA